MLDDLVVARVLSPLQRAVLVVESVPAAPDTLALVDAVADAHGENFLPRPSPFRIPHQLETPDARACVHHVEAVLRPCCRAHSTPVAVGSLDQQVQLVLARSRAATAPACARFLIYPWQPAKGKAPVEETVRAHSRTHGMQWHRNVASCISRLNGAQSHRRTFDAAQAARGCRACKPFRPWQSLPSAWLCRMPCGMLAVLPHAAVHASDGG